MAVSAAAALRCHRVSLAQLPLQVHVHATREKYAQTTSAAFCGSCGLKRRVKASLIIQKSSEKEAKVHLCTNEPWGVGHRVLGVTVFKGPGADFLNHLINEEESEE